MQDLQERGIIRTFGISVSDHRHDEANEIIKAGLVDIIEAPYSILDQRAAESLFPIAQQYRVSIIARSPLASGALAEDWRNSRRFHRTDWRRRVFRYEHLERTLQRVEKLRDTVGLDIPLAQIALRFCLSHPAVTVVIPGAQSAEHIACNFAALEHGPLSQETLEQVATLWHEEFQYHVQTSVG
jgi:aryl-alcohol dehydrogenase-like predicted oxidoreductase